MVFNSGDQARIVKILNLDRSQYRQNSHTKVKMDYLEDFDTAESTSLVAEVQQLLDQSEEIDEQIKAVDVTGASANYSVSIPQEISITRQQGPQGNPGNALLQQRVSYVAQIRNLIDPDDELRRYCNDGLALG